MRTPCNCSSELFTTHILFVVQAKDDSITFASSTGHEILADLLSGVYIGQAAEARRLLESREHRQHNPEKQADCILRVHGLHNRLSKALVFKQILNAVQTSFHMSS